jgi:hypothetical protein
MAYPLIGLLLCMAFSLIPGEIPLAAAALQPVPRWCPMAMQMALYGASGDLGGG